MSEGQSTIILRAPRAEDAEAVADLMRAYDVMVFGEPDTDVLDVRDEWGQPGFDLDRDAWIVEGAAGEALRAYACVLVREEGRDYDGLIDVNPGDSVPGLAPPLLERIEARVLERAPAGADLCFFASPAEREIRGILEGSGYQEVRTFFRMRIDLTPTEKPREPSGSIEIRTFRLGEEDRAIHQAIEDSFAEHFRHTPRTFEAWWTLRTSHERFDPALWLLAWDGARVAGALVAYDFGDVGFVRELGVRRDWRGRGVGSALLRRSFDAFRARGQLRVALGVDAENENAIGLYERVGMRVDSRHHLLRKKLAP